MSRCPPGDSVEQDMSPSFLRADRNLLGIPEHIDSLRPSPMFMIFARTLRAC